MIDEAWKDHLRLMDDLKQDRFKMQAAYEQKDPLLVYKMEGFNQFSEMLSTLNKDIASFLFKANLPTNDPNQVKEAQQRNSDVDRLKAGRDTTNSLINPQQNMQGPEGPPQQQQRKKQETVVRQGKKIKPNDPCPCGSGKKYKKCHGMKQAQRI